VSNWLEPSAGEHSPAYRRLEEVLAGGGCLVLDGGVATELERVRTAQRAEQREPWGTWALYQAPAEVLAVHRRYAATGCDVVSTNTWAILETAGAAPRHERARSGLPAWTETARAGVRLARQAVADAGRDGECAVSFCVNGGLAAHDAPGHLELLTWLWNEDPPDLVVFETLEAIPNDAALQSIRIVTEFGLPVWVSFRRCGGGMCDVEGHRHADADPRAFPAAVRQLEELGVAALLVNCVPVDAVPGAVEELAALTELPIGCYPNLGGRSPSGWNFDVETGPGEFARLARWWRDAGARIVGGCCGVTPAHVGALRAAAAAG
jgi:S-methylmethionine-dependent homocysteine/selenocysteine methylase